MGKTGAFLTAFASGHTIDQDATGEGYLLSPGLYNNLLLPYDGIAKPSENIINPGLTINPKIIPDVTASMNYSTNYFTLTNNYPTTYNVLANQNLGNTKYNYEVKPNESS